MPSFFSDDEDAPTNARPQAARPPAARGRAPPRLARHLRQDDPTANTTNNARASSSTVPSSPGPTGRPSLFGYRTRDSSDVTGMTSFDLDPDDGAGLPKRRVLDALDTDALFGGAGHVPLDDLTGTGTGGIELEDEETASDVTRLLKAWVRERGTPDMMVWEGDLVEECLHKLGQQATMLELLRADPKTSEEEHFKLIIVQTEMERVKYLVRAYLRCRLAKVEKYSQYITTTPEAQRLLSQLELSHAQKYTQLLHTHYQDSVLQSLPEKLRGLEVDFGTQQSMIRKPDKTVPVLIYCKKDLPDIVLSTGERAGMSAKSMHLVRYDLVERYIADGDVEVL